MGCYYVLIEIFNPTSKRLIIIDVINRLEEIQATKGTLIQEVVSKECMLFFEKAMKIARNEKHLELAYKIHELLGESYESFDCKYQSQSEVIKVML